MKLTPKQEKFATLYIELGNASEAYRQSYDCSRMKPEVVHVKAAELLENGKITVRIEELRAEHRQRHNLGVDDLLAELEQSRQAALTAETPQCGAAVSATMGKAKLLGLDKKIIKHEGEILTRQPTVNFDALSDDELDQLERIALKLADHSAGEG